MSILMKKSLMTFFVGILAMISFIPRMSQSAIAQDTNTPWWQITVERVYQRDRVQDIFRDYYSPNSAGSIFLLVEVTIEDVAFNTAPSLPDSDALISGVRLYGGRVAENLHAFALDEVMVTAGTSYGLSGFAIGSDILIAPNLTDFVVAAPYEAVEYTFIFVVPENKLDESFEFTFAGVTLGEVTLGMERTQLGDADDDGLSDSEDNCPADSNTNQADIDQDNVGDACDLCPEEAGTASGCPDGDEDSIADLGDNCPEIANVEQTDFNEDGIGDACQDTDADEFLDAEDRCPTEVGTVAGCLDSDGDAFADTEDSCPNEAGSRSANGCPDTDKDRVADAADNCPTVTNRNQVDFNNDGVGDACQDSDEDSFLDAEDDCLAEAGTFDGCPDSDEDSIADDEDSCPNEAGPSTTDGCPDGDTDGVADKDDQCPNEAGWPEFNGCLFTALVNPDNGMVNLREGPGTYFPIVGTASSEDQLVILGRNNGGDWLQIRLLPKDETAEPVEAWIAAWLVTTEAPIEDLPVIE